MNSLPINEVFQTIQGEASFTGTPAVFVRLQGCPVGCPWCDTKHTWHLEGSQRTTLAQVLAKQDDSPAYGQASTAELLKLLDGFAARHIVITGGEPCMYDLRELTAALLARGRSVQLETSGTHEVLCADGVWVTVSPKLHMPSGLPVLASAMRRANEVKHPVGKLADIEQLLGVLPLVPSGVQVWLQPLSQSSKATELCIAEAMQRGWRVSVQTHKFLGVR